MQAEQNNSAAVLDSLSDTLGEVFSGTTGSIEDMFNRMLVSARTHLGMEVAFISEFIAGRRVFRYVESALNVNIFHVGDSDPLDASYCKRLVEGFIPELIYDAQVLAQVQDLDITRGAPIGAYVSTPIKLKNGNIYGTFCVFSRTGSSTLNERDLAIVRVFADIAAAVLESHRDHFDDLQHTRLQIQELLDQERILAVAQPVVELNSGTIKGYEALTRVSGADWPPDQLFALAEKVNLSKTLGVRSVRNALKIFQDMSSQTFLAINATPEFVQHGNLSSLLADCAIERIVLEITEHVAISDYEAIQESLAPLRAQGMKLAVDDAGAGFASFKHILVLRPDIVKLDISLIRNIDQDKERQALALALITFCKQLQYELIAEGIETQAELLTLRSLGVTLGQGYLLAKPQPFEKFKGKVSLF